MRDITERMEGVDTGIAMLVGTNEEKIISCVGTILSDRGEYERMSKAVNPYGDGQAARRIAATLRKDL